MKLTRVYLTNTYSSFYQLLLFPMLNITSGGYCNYYAVYVDKSTNTVDRWNINRTHSHLIYDWMNIPKNIKKLVPIKEPMNEIIQGI